jgi:FKBP-type peptidyl-prolyl cis-trans isomerase
MACLFIFTGIGIGAISVWQSMSQDNNKTKQQENNVDKKLAGTKLANFTPVSKIDTLQTIDLKEGTGKEATASSTVTAHYTGAVASTGTIFQSSYDLGKPVDFSLAQVIKGWQLGVPGMKVGGTRRLMIPASLAYGATPPAGSGIPANADLVFEITLFDVK